MLELSIIRRFDIPFPKPTLGPINTHPVKLELDKNPACCPIITFLFPDSILFPANCPIITLSLALVVFCPELAPIITLLCPTVRVSPALSPTAVLFNPVATDRALTPTAVLSPPVVPAPHPTEVLVLVKFKQARSNAGILTVPPAVLG